MIVKTLFWKSSSRVFPPDAKQRVVNGHTRAIVRIDQDEMQA